jgi:hypothetical protein
LRILGQRQFFRGAFPDRGAEFFSERVIDLGENVARWRKCIGQRPDFPAPEKEMRRTFMPLPNTGAVRHRAIRDVKLRPSAHRV